MPPAFNIQQRRSTWKGEDALPRPARPLCERRPALSALAISDPHTPTQVRLPGERARAPTAFPGAARRQETSPRSGANSRGLRPTAAAGGRRERGRQARVSAEPGAGRRGVGRSPSPSAGGAAAPPRLPPARPGSSASRVDRPPALPLILRLCRCLFLLLSGLPLLLTRPPSQPRPVPGLQCHPLVVLEAIITLPSLTHPPLFTSALSRIAFPGVPEAPEGQINRLVGYLKY